MASFTAPWQDCLLREVHGLNLEARCHNI